MKLESLHINGFGQLHDFDYSFDNKISYIIEDNGYGKSTIVSFIVAMFYGLDVLRDKSNKFTDREHFYPFNQGSFGGSIKFIYQNKEYVIERNFDAKSLSKDILTVFKNNKKTKELGEVPGETIFKINKDNFSKFLIINAKEIELSSNDEINQHISNYVNNLDDDISLEEALENNKKAIKDNKKQYNELSSKISNYLNEAKNIDSIEKEIFDKREELAEVILKQARIEEEYKSINKYQDLRQKFLIYDEYFETYKNAKQEFDSFSKGFKVPSEEDLDSLNRINNQLIELNALVKTQNISESEAERFATLDQKFHNNLPSKEMLLAIEHKVFEMNSLDSHIKKIDENFDEIKYRGNIQAIVQANITLLLEKKYGEYLSKQDELAAISPFTIEEKSPKLQLKTYKSPVFLSFLILTILLFISGLALIFFYLVPGIIVMAFGVIFTFMTIFIYFNRSVKNVKNSSSFKNITNPDYQLKQQEITELSSFLKNILQVYGYYNNSNNIVELFEAYNEDKAKYQQYCLDTKNTKTQKDTLLEERNLLEKEIKDFLHKYDFAGDDLLTMLNALKNDLEQYHHLQKKIEEIKNKKESLNKEIALLLDERNEFYSKYNYLDSFSYDELNTCIFKYNNIKEKLTKEKAKCDKYRSDYHLTEENRVLAFLSNNTSQLDDERKKIYIQINNLNNEIARLENEVDNKRYLNNQAKELQIKLQEISYAISIKNSANDEIIKARDFLNEKYVKPIKDKFVMYAKELEDKIGEKVKMDNKYTISFERNGINRDYRHLSSGNLSLCAFSFRLAILDNVFLEDKPFIILDDPFVYLDKKHFAKALSLTDSLAKNFQIIYLSCRHEK